MKTQEMGWARLGPRRVEGLAAGSPKIKALYFFFGVMAQNKLKNAILDCRFTSAAYFIAGITFLWRLVGFPLQVCVHRVCQREFSESSCGAG